MKNKALVVISGIFSLLSFNLSAQIPTAAFTLNQATVCAGSVISITDASSDLPNTWSYTVQGIASPFTTQNPTLTISSPGVYSISLIASNGFGSSPVVTETISIASLPVVSAGASATICEGTYITFNGSGATSYVWSGGIIDGASFALTSSANYTVTGTDVNGCENTSTKSVSVNPLPILNVNGPAGICVGASITLTVSGANTYTWDSGVNTTTLTDTPLVTITYSVTGKNTVTGCTNTIEKLITVNELPIVYVNSGDICAGHVFTMNPGGASTYVFSNSSATVSPGSNTSYTVTGTDGNGCSATAVSEVTVYALPTLSVNSGSFCAGSGFTINPTGAFSYTILPGNSLQVNPVSNASYSVTGTDVNGCISPAMAVSHVTVLSLPVISVNSGSICAGQVFTMNPTGTFSFSFSSGSNTVSPLSDDTYTVVAEDGNGCFSQPVVSTVSVFSIPVITVNSGSICSGDSFSITPLGASTYTFINGSSLVSPTTNSSYTITGTSANGCLAASSAISEVTVYALPAISVNSGSICSGETFTLLPSGADSYSYEGGSAFVAPTADASYTVVGFSEEGCMSSNIAIATITVMALPSLSISSNSAICLGETVTLTASGASTYTWDTNSHLANFIDNPIMDTVYSVMATAVNGCTNIITQAIIVYPLPTVSVVNGVICPGNSFTLNPSGASNYTFSGGSIVTPASTTSYTITGESAEGCVALSAAIVTVNVVSPFTVAVIGNTVVCQGLAATISAGGASSYSWSTGALTNVVVLTPAVTTNYTVTGFISNCSNTTVVTVSVNPLPSLTISSTSSLICTGESATLSVDGANTFDWGTGITGNTLVVNPTSNTTYSVIGVGANSCASYAAITQNVDACLGFTKNSINSIYAEVFPNPTDGGLAIKITEASLVNIFDGTGRLVYNAKLDSGENKIDLTDQGSGMYFIQLSQNGQVRAIKLIKR